MTVPKLPPVPLPWRPLTEDEIWASDAIMGENGRRAGLLLLDLVALVRAVEEEIQVRFAPPDQSARIAALENSLAERDRVIEQARVAMEYHMAQTRPIQLTIDVLRVIQEVQR